MADCATESHCFKTAILVKGSFQTEDGIELDQGQRSRRIIEVDLTLLDLLHQIRGQRININFQTNCERRLGTHPWSDAAELAALNCILKFELICPVDFIAERVVTENSPSFLEHLLRIAFDLSIEAHFVRLVLLFLTEPSAREISESSSRKEEHHQNLEHDDPFARLI